MPGYRIILTIENTVQHEKFKFYGFKIACRIVKLKSVNFYYYAAKILSCFDYRKI